MKTKKSIAVVLAAAMMMYPAGVAGQADAYYSYTVPNIVSQPKQEGYKKIEYDGPTKFTMYAGETLSLFDEYCNYIKTDYRYNATGITVINNKGDIISVPEDTFIDLTSGAAGGSDKFKDNQKITALSVGKATIYLGISGTDDIGEGNYWDSIGVKMTINVIDRNAETSSTTTAAATTSTSTVSDASTTTAATETTETTVSETSAETVPVTTSTASTTTETTTVSETSVETVPVTTSTASTTTTETTTVSETSVETVPVTTSTTSTTAKPFTTTVETTVTFVSSTQTTTNKTVSTTEQTATTETNKKMRIIPEKDIMVIGDEEELVLVNVPKDGKVKWTSSNTDVLTVDNGKVKAVHAGYAEVYAVCGDEKVVCKIDVNDPNISMGDANLDDIVSAADAVTILQYLGNRDKYDLCSMSIFAADVYSRGDGVTAMDALSIQKYDAGVITSLPESWATVVIED